jgi:hypothetical protein
MNTRVPPPPPPPPAGPMPVFHDGPRPPQQHGFPPMHPRFFPPPLNSTTRFADITPRVEITEEFCRRELTSYDVYSLRKAEPLKSRNFQENKKDNDTKKQKKGSKRPLGPKPDWQRVVISQDILDQDVILKKIKYLNNKGKKSITDKKAELSPHMNRQVNDVLDDKNNSEFDPAFTWTLSQLDRQTSENKETKRWETDTLTLYLKRAPRPEVNVVVVYRNIEKAKLQQGQPPPPPPQQFQNQQPPPQPRAPSQGPPGQPRQPIKVGPPPPKIIQDPKNGGKFGGKGGKGGHEDEIQVIETGGPERKAGKTVYNRRKSVRYHSDDSRSSRSSRSSSSSRSDSDSGSAYSDSETDPSSISLGSINRRRRDSGYRRGKGKALKQHEKGYFMVDRPRRHSASYVPDPPRMRAQSYERTSTDPIEVVQQLSEAKAEGFAAGYTTGARVAAIDRTTTMPPQRTIMYPDDRSQRSSLRSLDEEVRALDETRAEVARLEHLRLQDELRQQEDLRLRNELRMREEANARLREELRRSPEVPTRADLRLREELRRFSEASTREDLRLREELRRFPEAPTREDLRLREEFMRFPEVPTREELRLRTDLRRAQDIILQDELPSPRMRDPDYLRRGSLSPLSFDSMPSPRTRDFEYPRRGSLSPLSLDHDMPYQYVRNPNPNPFTPRRRQPLYRD